MDRLINAMREKIDISSKPEQVQILTITPESWSIRRTGQEFKVSEHLVRKARKLRCEKGILGKPDAKKGQQIPQSVKDKVLEFDQLDDFTWLRPGKKDFVSVFLNGKKVHKQKRLILLRLKELYIEFKKMYPDYKIGFSKFCELRLKWCITVNSSEAHCVCVCTYHQNAKLMCSFLPNNR